jgi:hypothetical protein
VSLIDEITTLGTFGTVGTSCTLDALEIGVLVSLIDSSLIINLGFLF